MKWKFLFVPIGEGTRKTVTVGGKTASRAAEKALALAGENYAMISSEEVKGE